MVVVMGKRPLRHGWTEGPLRASVLFHEMANMCKSLPSQKFNRVQIRADQSYNLYFLLMHVQYKEQVPSVKQERFFVKHKENETYSELESRYYFFRRGGSASSSPMSSTGVG